jgi:hypothetical protein
MKSRHENIPKAPYMIKMVKSGVPEKLEKPGLEFEKWQPKIPYDSQAFHPAQVAYIVLTRDLGACTKLSSFDYGFFFFSTFLSSRALSSSSASQNHHHLTNGVLDTTILSLSKIQNSRW